MPLAELQDVQIHYEWDGPEDAPVLVFCNSLGTNLRMWDPQIADFSEHLRVLRYDTRGFGASTVTPGPYSIELLANDVLHLLDALHFDRVHFCGLSMGGQTGIWLGLHASERLHKLILCNTGAKIGALDTWNARIDAVLARGMKDVSSAVLGRWFTPEFAAQHPDVIAKTKTMLESTNPQGYAHCCAALREFDARETVSSIAVPTLIIAGSLDLATPAADGRFLAEKIPAARYAEFHAAHLSNIEAAAQFTPEIEKFLSA
jgi:3-oxoadipate enol-lactonase